MSGAGADRTGVGLYAPWHVYSPRIHTSHSTATATTSLQPSHNEVIVVHDDSSEPEANIAANTHRNNSSNISRPQIASGSSAAPINHYQSPHYSSQPIDLQHKGAAALATVAPSPSKLAGASASTPKSSVSTIGNTFSQLSLPSMNNTSGATPATATPQVYDLLSQAQNQPRYMTRSVAQNVARRKQELMMLEQLKEQQNEDGSASAQPLAISANTGTSQINNAYGTFDYQNQIYPNNQQPLSGSTATWSSSVLYQTARAVAAAADSKARAPPSMTAAQRQKAAAAAAAGADQPPAPKRRRNAAAASSSSTAATIKTAAQKAPRGRATQRARQQQQKAEPSCDDRDGHYIVVPGREFTPRFKIRRLLGQGTFGKVMECEDASSGRLVAIKVIRAVPKYRDAAKIEIRVLQTLQRNDPKNVYQCMHVNETFDHRNHVCMVFDLLGPSVFDFLKENEFRPFSLHHVQLFAEQLLRSVAFLHSLDLVHTDLKPENILLESGDYDVVPFANSQSIKTHMLKSTKIRLIDFGSATFNKEYHSQVVSTRHYRAPEIILNLGWSFPCDMWSIGCIILELLTGEALFQTHDNNEHLAMMEVVVGKAPPHVVRSVSQDLRVKFFRDNMSARYPAPDQPRQSQKGLRAMRPLSEMVNPSSGPIHANLHDLLFRLLQYDPWARISAKEACDHPFFRYRVGPDGHLTNRPSALATTASHSHRQLNHAMAPAADMAPPEVLHTGPAAMTATVVPSHHHHNHMHQNPPRQAYPAASAIGMPQLPASVAVASSTAANAYPYGSSSGSGTVRGAPLQLSDYSISAASLRQWHYQQPETHASLASDMRVNRNPAALTSLTGGKQGHYARNIQQVQPQPQPQQQPTAPTSAASVSSHNQNYYSDYSNRPTPLNLQLSQAQQQARAHAEAAYPWHYAGSANNSTITTPTATHPNTSSVGHHTTQMVAPINGSSYAQQQAYPASGSVSQSRTSGKRKAGAPVDSGFFPELPTSTSEYFPVPNGDHQSSPVAGAPLRSSVGSGNQQNYQQPRTYSSVSMVPPLGYSASHNGNKGYNLPPLASQSFQHCSSSAALAMAPLLTPTSSSLSLSQQQHRHMMHSGVAASGITTQKASSVLASNNGVVQTRMPIDYTTPRLTTATTATPTPGSSSAHLNAPPHGVDSSSISASAAASIAAGRGASAVNGTHKLAGRSLPSLMITNTSTIPPVTTVTNGGTLRASLCEVNSQQQSSRLSGVYQQLPSAQTLLQSPTQTQAPVNGPVDYIGSPYHYHQSYHSGQHFVQSPRAANNPSGY
ncbi:serine threonine protein kinase CMGC group [Coemansia interrupta]|uniref:Serine threonine protein kinase CMGC group n=1 Tax=Coemansia interrupta TaxID=1126814 RepID=A0A9W8HKA0_9FUNG|nr:serine threonine protein kinase CMGC group [Coemansia interrupta]